MGELSPQRIQVGGSSRPLGDFWERQQLSLCEILGKIVPQGGRAVFLDVPVYMNVGDLMIYLGTERWIEDHGLEILGRWSLYNFRYPDLSPDVTILLQGGGNFGDLYPFQRFREQVIERYPDNRFVVLPQTVHYAHQAAQESSRRILKRHGDLHLLSRDTRSLEIARRMAPDGHCELAPDMSIHLYPLPANLDFDQSSDRQGAIYLLRKDTEENPDQPIPDIGSGWTGDWRQMLGYHFWYLRVLKLRHLLLGRGYSSEAFAADWRRATKRAVRHCAARFAGAEFIVTSRLHGHLLASMLGVPNLVLDNSYGKNSLYFETWHRSLPCAELAEYSR